MIEVVVSLSGGALSAVAVLLALRPTAALDAVRRLRYRDVIAEVREVAASTGGYAYQFQPHPKGRLRIRVESADAPVVFTVCDAYGVPLKG